MKYKITGKNIEVSESIENTIKEELQSLDKYFINKDLEANVLIRTYNIGQKVEISIMIDKDHTLRQEEMQGDLYDAIRFAVKKMERQVRKFKDRITDNSKKEGIMALFTNEEHSKEQSKIIKRKVFEDKLMNEDEAILQFELTGHDFFIFTDADSLVTKLLYKRRDSEYGIIEIEK